ncbi:MAG: glycosyltransferase family 4 protein [Lysobacter sp.]
MSKPSHPRILMVLEGPYPAAHGGGAETQVRTLTRAMHRQGLRVAVVAPLTEHAPQSPVSRVDGVPVFRLRYPRVRLLGGLLLWAALVRFLWAHRDDYDVWHVHVARQWAVICALLGPWLGKRVVIKIAGSWDLERGVLAGDQKPWNKLAKRILLRTHGWQAISRRIAATLPTLGVPQSRVWCIPNAVDTARFGQLLPSSLSAARFLFIGRLMPEKGLITLLQAFSDIAAGHPQAHLTIAGTGWLRAELESFAEACGISTRVTFAGHRDDIDNLLLDANVGVLPSFTEGLSNTLLESMAAGLPMVASRVSGNEDLIHDGENGWLFEPGDRAGLARCLDAAAAMLPAHRQIFGECARRTVSRHASLEIVLGRLIGFYQGGACTDDAVAQPRNREA